jgi:hypothetical protein
MKQSAHVLLIGNGINRTVSSASWEELLANLDPADHWSPEERASLNFPVLFEALAERYPAATPQKSQQQL